MSDLDWQKPEPPPPLDDRASVGRAFSDPISTPTEWFTWLLRKLELRYPFLSSPGASSTTGSTTTAEECCIPEARWWYGLGDNSTADLHSVNDFGTENEDGIFDRLVVSSNSWWGKHPPGTTTDSAPFARRRDHRCFEAGQYLFLVSE